MTEIAAPIADPNPWVPEADLQKLKALGKLCEESAELCAAAARCMIQGIEEAEPVTGKPNRQWIEEEIADVEANVAIVVEHFGLDEAAIGRRTARKHSFILRWLRMIPAVTS